MEPVIYRRLSQLVDRFKVDKHHKAKKYVKDLFEALDWGSRPTFSIAEDEGFGYQLIIDRSPVINILTAPPSQIETVYVALNRAYNQDVGWVVATDFDSLGLYGSYWVSFRYDVSSAEAFRFHYPEYPLEAHRLELLTPQDVGQNRINELYSAYPGRKRRIPIDVHLIDRMSGWRHLALNALQTVAPHQDALIHRLINTLFLIRYVEDTGMSESQPRLIDLVNEANKGAFVNALHTLFDQIHRRTGYPVPNRRQLKTLEDTPLRTLVRQLYGYSDLGIEYNFAAMNVDVLGRFYEEYLRLNVLPAPEEPKTPRITLFDQPSYEIEDVRKKRGVYYTPRYIVDYILRNLIERFKVTHPSGGLPHVVDIATGSGTFLSAALDWLQEFFPNQSPKDLVKYLAGLDIDERAIEAARLSLTAKLVAHDLTTASSKLNLRCIDLILNGPSSKAILENLPEKGADIVVGNPPYINYEGLKRRYGSTALNAIAGNFETAEGRFDSYILFTEVSVKLLSNGGLGGLVLPNRFLTGRSAASLRRWVAERTDVLEVVDFIDQPVFQGVGSYVCLLLFRKKSPTTTSPQVTVGKLYYLSEAPASQLARISVVSDDLSGGIESFRVNQPRGTGPWIFRNKGEVEVFELMKNVSDDLLEEIVDIRQGVKTGADGIFVIEASRMENNLFRIHSASAERIESDLLIPVFRNKDLRRWGARPVVFVIYPYDKEKGKLLQWNVIARKYPAAAAYLTTHKQKLSGRKSLRGKEWYALIEPRLHLLRSGLPRLFVTELSLRPTICQTALEHSLILGGTGGGSVMEVKKAGYDVAGLMAYLNSVLVEWFVRQVSPHVRGGYILLEQKVLGRLPIPRFLQEESSFARTKLVQLSSQLAAKLQETGAPPTPQLRQEIAATEEQIDSLVLEALKVTALQGDYIRQSVKVVRQRLFS